MPLGVRARQQLELQPAHCFADAPATACPDCRLGGSYGSYGSLGSLSMLADKSSHGGAHYGTPLQTVPELDDKC
jgi:hypothetical protein